MSADLPVLLEPKEVQIPSPDGKPKTYVIGKMDCIKARKIAILWNATSLPKIGDYEANEGLMLELMKYVAVPVKGAKPMRLMTPELIANHVVSYPMLKALEDEVKNYNYVFFSPDGPSDSLTDWITNPRKFIQTLTDSLAQSLAAVRQRSTN